MKKLYFLLFTFIFQFTYSQDLLIGNQGQLDALAPLPTTFNGYVPSTYIKSLKCGSIFNFFTARSY